MSSADLDSAPIRAHLEEILPNAIEMLRDLVNINSFTRNAAGVDQLGKTIAQQFQALGFTADHVPSANSEHGHHLVLTRAGSGSHTIGFVSHLDTVFPPQEEIDNDFSWRLESHEGKTRIYGPGTVDIKGGTIMMYMVLSALQAKLPQLFEQVTWKLFLNAAEEELVPEFGELCRSRMDQDQTLACLVYEGGYRHEDVFQFVTSRKGMARYNVAVTGRASHAGANHAAGANAVTQLAEIAISLANLTDYDRQLTFNVGVIKGGTVVNRVPHHAELELEFRCFDPGVFAEAQISLKSLDGYSTVKSPLNGVACDTAVMMRMHASPWPQNDATQKLYQMWAKAANSLGYKVEEEARGGLSDGNYLWEHVPTLDGLGPMGANAHCSERSEDGSRDQEYVIKESFIPKAMLNVQGLFELARVHQLV